jgi:hypothetical protein
MKILFFGVLFSWGLTIALTLGGCPGNTPAPIVPDATDAMPLPPSATCSSASVADCTLACSALQKAGCSIGARPDCPTFLVRDLGSCRVPNPSTQMPLTCPDVGNVKTVIDAMKLGFVCGDL